MGGDGGGVVPRGGRGHRDPRPEPARAAGTDDARLARRRVPRPRTGVRLDGPGDRRARRRADRPGLSRRGVRRPADVHRGENGEGPRCVVPGRSGGMARQGGAGRADAVGDRRARRRAAPGRDAALAPGAGAPRPGTRGRGLAETRLRRPDRDPQGRRRRARVARTPGSRPRGPRRRGRQLDVHRRGGGGRAGTVRPDVHRRAEHDRRADRAAGPRQDGVRGHLRRVPDAGGRPDPDGRDQPRGSADQRVARGDLDRRGRPLADGGRGSVPVPDAERIDRALPRGRQQRRAARHDDARPRGHLVPAEHARGDAGAVPGGRDVPESAARRRWRRPATTA